MPPRATASSTDEGLQGLQGRERLLEAGTELFSQRGFAASSVGAICARAGVGKPALYWHFDSKQGLLVAVLDAVVRRWIQEIRRQTDAVGDPGQRLQRMVSEMRKLVLEEPQLLRLPILAALEQGGDSEQIRGAVLEIWDLAADAIAAGAAAATGRPAEQFEAAAFAATSLLQAAAVRYSIDQDVERLDRNLRTLERVMLAILMEDLR